MSVQNGEEANATTFNSSFISTEDDSQTVAKIDLNRTGSGDQIPDAQQQINDNKDAIENIDGDYVDLSTDQTVSGEKTFSSNMAVNATVTADDVDIKDGLITVNKDGSDASSEGAGLEVERVGDNGSLKYENLLDNKFKIGTSGAEIEVSGIVKDTLLNLQEIVSPSSSNIYFATDSLEAFRSDGSQLLPFGSGDGGAGSPSIYGLFNAENDDVTDFSNISINSTNPIDKEKDYNVDSFPANFPDVDIQNRNRGKENSMRFHYSLASGSFKVLIKDESANVLNELIIDEVGTARPASIEFPVNSETTVTLHLEDVVSATSVRLDDVVFDDDPFVYKNLTESLYIEAAGNGGTALTAGTTNIDFTEVSDSSGVWDGTTFTVSRSDSVISISGSVDVSGSAKATRNVNIYKNGTNYKTINSFNDSTEYLLSYESYKGEFTAGDLLTFRAGLNNGTLNNSTIAHHLTITESWGSEHVVTPAKSTYQFYSIRQAQSSMANLATEVQFALVSATVIDEFNANPFLVAEDDTPNTRTKFVAQDDCFVESRSYGAVSSGDLSFYVNGVLLDGGDKVGANDETFTSTIINLSKGDFITVAANGGGLASNATECQVTFLAKAKDATFLAAVPVQKVVYLKDIKPSGTAGGTFTSGSFQDRDLNSVEGDSSIVDLLTNEFTLKKEGKYLVEAKAIGYDCDTHKCAIYNVSDAVIEEIGLSVRSPTNVGLNSEVDKIVTITSAKTYKLQHRCSVTKATNGFGLAAGYGVDEVYATVKITKLR